MNVLQYNRTRDRYEWYQTLADGESLELVIPRNVFPTVTVIPTSEVSIESSTSSHEDIRDGSAKWVPETESFTAPFTSQISATLTAIKFTSTGGSTDVEVLA